MPTSSLTKKGSPMRPYTEAPPKDPSADGDQPMLQRVFGHPQPDRNDDEHPVGEDVDGQTADATPSEDQLDADERAADDRHTALQPAADQRDDETASHEERPPDAVVDGEPHGERRMDAPGDIHRDDDLSTTHDAEPAALEDAAQHDPAVHEPIVDEPTAGAGAAEPTSPDEPTDLKPGDGPAVAVTAIWSEDSAQDFRDRWREAQLRFVDDPQKAADDTRGLVNEAVEALTAALARHREQLNSWPADGDTELYRVIVQRYRTFFERLLTL
jgi:hypothetical protein